MYICELHIYINYCLFVLYVEKNNTKTLYIVKEKIIVERGDTFFF